VCWQFLTCNQATVQLYSPTAARQAGKYDAAVSVYTAYNDSHRNVRKYQIDSQTPENTSHFAMRITLFSSLVHWLRTYDKSHLVVHGIRLAFSSVYELISTQRGDRLTFSDSLMCVVTELCRRHQLRSWRVWSRRRCGRPLTAPGRGVVTPHRSEVTGGIRFQNPISRDCRLDSVDVYGT